VPEQPSLQPALNWTTLDNLLAQLEIEASSLSETSLKLLSRLEVSETRAAELSLSLEQSELSLTACAESLSRATQDLRRRKFEAALWRVGALSGALGVVGALVDPAKARGCAAGVIVGAVAGALWWIADR